MMISKVKGSLGRTKHRIVEPHLIRHCRMALNWINISASVISKQLRWIGAVLGQIVSIPADLLVVGVKDEAQAPTHQTHLSLPSIVGQFGSISKSIFCN